MASTVNQDQQHKEYIKQLEKVASIEEKFNDLTQQLERLKKDYKSKHGTDADPDNMADPDVHNYFIDRAAIYGQWREAKEELQKETKKAIKMGKKIDMLII